MPLKDEMELEPPCPPPPFGEPIAWGERTPVSGNPVFEAPLYPCPAVSFSNEIHKSNTVDRRHVWSQPGQL